MRSSDVEIRSGDRQVLLGRQGISHSTRLQRRSLQPAPGAPAVHVGIISLAAIVGRMPSPIRQYNRRRLERQAIARLSSPAALTKMGPETRRWLSSSTAATADDAYVCREIRASVGMHLTAQQRRSASPFHATRSARVRCVCAGGSWRCSSRAQMSAIPVPGGAATPRRVAFPLFRALAPPPRPVLTNVATQRIASR